MNSTDPANQDLFWFSDEGSPGGVDDALRVPVRHTWSVMVIDDDADVHRATQFALEGSVLFDRRIELVHAHSAAQARDLLLTHGNIALVLLDVVMETHDAGLQRVDFIRNVAGHRATRTVLRTGLQRSDFERFLAQVETAADISTRNLGRASELIASFKRVAVDQTSSQRRVFDLAEVVHEIVLTLQPTLKHTPYQVMTDVPAGLVLDSYPGPLGQVLSNLVQNAVVHAFGDQPKGRIDITAQAVGDAFVLTVADNGEGIAPEHLEKVFDPFFITRLGQGGSGLGLHIVHNVVTGLLCGQIEVRSVVGQGTAVVIRCPCVAPQRTQPEALGA